MARGFVNLAILETLRVLLGRAGVLRLEKVLAPTLCLDSIGVKPGHRLAAGDGPEAELPSGRTGRRNNNRRMALGRAVTPEPPRPLEPSRAVESTGLAQKGADLAGVVVNNRLFVFFARVRGE